MASAIPTDYGTAGQPIDRSGVTFKFGFSGETFTAAEDAPTARWQARYALEAGSPHRYRGAGCRPAQGSGRPS